MTGYGYNGMGLMPPQANNNLWVGNNYSSGSWQSGPNRHMSSQLHTQQQPQTMNNVLEVMGPESAINFQVGPNSKVVMMDANRPVFYFKHSDDSGYAETRAFKFEEIPLMEKPVEVDAKVEDPNYATKDDIEEIKKQLGRKDYVTKADFDKLKKMIEGMGGKSA